MSLNKPNSLKHMIKVKKSLKKTTLIQEFLRFAFSMDFSTF